MIMSGSARTRRRLKRTAPSDREKMKTVMVVWNVIRRRQLGTGKSGSCSWPTGMRRCLRRRRRRRRRQISKQGPNVYRRVVRHTRTHKRDRKYTLCVCVSVRLCLMCHIAFTAHTLPSELGGPVECGALRTYSSSAHRMVVVETRRIITTYRYYKTAERVCL